MHVADILELSTDEPSSGADFLPCCEVSSEGPVMCCVPPVVLPRQVLCYVGIAQEDKGESVGWVPGYQNGLSKGSFLHVDV